MRGQPHTRFGSLLVILLSASVLLIADDKKPVSQIGQEHAIPRHLQDDEEFAIPMTDLLEYGRKVFMANWTVQDGAGRPMMKGNGTVLSDPSAPLVNLRAFNRLSGPDANSCYG